MEIGVDTVSIISTTYTQDRFNDTVQLIDSIALQTNKNYRLFMVVERSPELAQNITEYIKEKQYSNMIVLFNEGPHGLSSARNLAIRQSQSDILAFVDDDAIVDTNWTNEIIKTFEEDSSVAGVTGPIDPLWERQSMAWFPPEFFWIFSCTYNNPKEKIEVRNGYGTNLSFKRKALLQAGLFNPDLGVKGRGKSGWQEPGAEETEISLRIKNITGKHIIFNPKVKIQHKVYAYRTKTKFIAKRAFWEGYAKALLKARHNESKSGTNVLSTEYSLLKRILFYRIPRDFMLLFKHPILAMRQLRLVFTVLSCVAAGYFTYTLKSGFKALKGSP
jgi:glucosyl-dolichyl phosphate glucuronosyltransferase